MRQPRARVGFDVDAMRRSRGESAVNDAELERIARSKT